MDELEQQEYIRLKLKELERLDKITSAFVPDHLDSRPSEVQARPLKALANTVKYIYVAGGNQCLAEGTLVLTPRGPVPIEKMSPGDTVYDENGKEIKVLNVFSNGKKPVHALTCRGKIFAKSTLDHRWLVEDGHGREHERTVSEFRRDDKVLRQRIKTPLGNVSIADSYKLPYEREVTLAEVKTWDRETCLNFMAGLLPNINPERDSELILDCRLLSTETITLINYLMLALWQIELTYDETKNILSVEDAAEIRYIFEDIVPFSSPNCRRISYKINWDELNKVNVAVSTASKAVNTYDLEVDSPRHLYCLANGMVTHNSSKTSVLIRNLVWVAEETHPYWEKPISHKCNNKLCGNEYTKLLSSETDVSSGIFRYYCPKCNNTWLKWREDEPICLILSGQQLKNIQENLYVPRIKKLFQYPDDWEEYKLGSPFVQKVTNKNTGNTIIFFPHGHGEEQARKATQGYTVHMVFMDEQAPVAVMEELQRRVDARFGCFMSAFTMKRRDPQMTRFMESQIKSGVAVLYKIAQFDNPLYSGMRETILARVAGLSESKRNAILYGEMATGEDELLVFPVDSDVLQKQLPQSYHIGWKHVEIVDPAIKSVAGRLVCAQDPETKRWWVRKAQYIRGMKHDMHLVEELIRLRHTEGFNFVLHVSDDSANFRGAAAHHFSSPINYIAPPSKRRKSTAGGKRFLIDQTRYYLDQEFLYIPAEFHLLWDEFFSCEWKENSEDGIKNSHRFHLLDTVMYFFDTLPEEDKRPDEVRSYIQELLDYNYYGIVPKDIEARRAGEIQAEINKLKSQKKTVILVPNSQIDKVLGKPKWRW